MNRRRLLFVFLGALTLFRLVYFTQYELTPDEAAHGCVVPVGVPVFHRCPRCGGSGRDLASECSFCRRQGLIETEAVVPIRIPGGARSGSIFELSLDRLGIHNLRLRMHVFVEA